MSEPTEEMIQVALELFEAASAGETARLLAYVDAGVPVDLTDHQGNTLLILAAYDGHSELVDGLAERGANVNVLNDNQHSALAGALFKGHEDVAATLVRRGADPDLGHPSGREVAEHFQRTLPEA